MLSLLFRGALSFAAGSLVLSSVASAAAPVPIQSLSAAQRLSTAPASTAVVAGRVTTTVGNLRAQHKARESALSSANAAGMQTLKFAPMPIPIVRGLGGHPGTFVVEPAAMYASQPADKKAFCAGAHASACAYLPPQQTVAQGNGAATDPDFLITDPQCSHEGGTMVTVQGIAGSPSSTSCNFVYATNVSVPFKPAKDFKLKQSASCHSPWTYSVDVHGAVSIAIAAGTPVVVTTGSVATCVVRVVTGP